MSRILFTALCLFFQLSSFAQETSVEGFKKRFKLVKNEEGKVVVIKLQKAVTQFSLKPFLDQIKNDLLKEQNAFNSLTPGEKEAEIEELMNDLGAYQFVGSETSEYSEKIREALLNIPNINVERTFTTLQKGDFWKEFEAKLKDAYLFIDPSVLANLEDPRFFYKKNVTYQVVQWALKEAQKRFSNVPVLNIASFVIVRVHDMLLEQRHFHHNMLLHYVETVPETRLGMTKEEVDRTVSSIHEYRIEATNFIESNKAARDWLNYGMNNFYITVRAGNNRVRTWSSPFSPVKFTDVKKVNFAFAEVTEGAGRMIYHLHHTAHMFSSKPSLAFDYTKPQRVQKNRALLNLAGVGLGFIPMPGWLKSNVDSFIKSFYVQQVRMEGALVGYFESTGNTQMTKSIFNQRANFYIVE